MSINNLGQWRLQANPNNLELRQVIERITTNLAVADKGTIIGGNNGKTLTQIVSETYLDNPDISDELIIRKSRYEVADYAKELKPESKAIVINRFKDYRTNPIQLKGAELEAVFIAKDPTQVAQKSIEILDANPGIGLTGPADASPEYVVRYNINDQFGLGTIEHDSTDIGDSINKKKYGDTFVKNNSLNEGVWGFASSEISAIWMFAKAAYKEIDRPDLPTAEKFAAGLGSRIAGYLVNDGFASKLIAQSLGEVTGSWVGIIIDRQLNNSNETSSLLFASLYKPFLTTFSKTLITLSNTRISDAIIKYLDIEDPLAQTGIQYLTNAVVSHYFAEFAVYKFGAEFAQQSLGIPDETVKSITSNSDFSNFASKFSNAVYSQFIGLASDKLSNAIIRTLKIEDKIPQLGIDAFTKTIVSQQFTELAVDKLGEEFALKYLGIDNKIVKAISNNNGLSIVSSDFLNKFASSALGEFIGTDLYRRMIDKWNILSEDYSKQGAAIGSTIGAYIGSFIPIPVVGTAIGSLLGGIIGGTFGDKDYPRAAYTVTIENGIFVAKFAFNLDGGSTSLAQQMGNNAKDILNFLASSVGGKLSPTGNIILDMYFYGHYLNSYFYKDLRVGADAAGGSSDWRYPNRFSNAQDAIIRGIIDQIKAAEFEGGDLYIKRLLKSLPTDVNTLDKLNADFQVAREWGIYKDNSVLYEKNIHYLKANAIKDAETRILDLRSQSQSSVTPNRNYALKFDGVNDYLESASAIIPTQGTNNPFSVSVWAKIDPSIQKGLFELVSQGSGGNAFYIGGQNGKIRAGDTWINTGIDVPGDGLWHLFTVVRDNSNTHLYIDGQLKASKGSVIANPANTVFRVGRQYGDYLEIAKATIGEVSVWNTAISAVQVQGMTKDALTGGEGGLVAYWKLNEGIGSVAKDKSQFQRHLTIKEAEWASGIDPKVKDFNLNVLPSQVTLSLQTNDLIINGERFTNWVNAQNRLEILRFADGSRFKIVVNNGLVKLEDERVANWQQIQTRVTQLNLNTPNSSDNFVNNNASRIVQGSDYALKFDGVNDHLESASAIIPTQGTNNPFTVSVWAKVDPSIQKGLFEFVSQGTGGNAFYIGGQNGKIRVGDTWLNSGVDVPGDGQWHLYTVVRTQTNTQVYIDGELKASKGSIIANPANTVFRIGRQYGGFWEVPKATIGEVSVWNTAISAAQIQTMSKQPLAGSEAGLVGYWQLNEGTGTIANDKSSFKRNLTIKEAEWTARNVGGIGDDVLIPTGSGQLLDGDKGDDIYRYNRGQGTITIKDAGGLDTIEFDASIQLSDLLFQQSGSNLIIALKDPNNPTAAISSLPNKLILSDFATKKIERLRLGNNEEYSITTTGLTANNQPIKVDRALSFDGIDDSVLNTAKFADVKDTFTIEFWANPTATRASTPQATSGVTGINSQRYAIAPLNGSVTIGAGHVYAGVSVGTNGISLFEHSGNYLPSLLVHNTNLSGWNHVAIIYNNKTPSLYLNGQFVKTGLTSTGIVHPSALLGGLSNYGSFQGSLDEVRIWNKARTQAEIQADLNRTLTGSQSGLVAYYNFDEITGTTVKDLTINQNNGTILGATRNIKTLFGTEVNDTYTYNLGDPSNVTIHDIGNYEGTIRDGGIDSLEFGTGITLNSLQLTLQNSNLIVKVNNTSTITIQDWIKSQSKIEIFRLADGKEYNPLLNFDGTVSLQAAFSPGNPNYNLATDKPETYSVSSNKLLTFDLGADGLQLISAADSMTLFNIDNDAYPEQMGWVAPSDGFLVWDRNNDGLITSLTEFFSLQQQNQVGFLGAIDTNQDLVIDSKDSNFSQLRIWTDTNLNGEVELGELAALYRYGVNSISITPQTKNYNIAGNKITASAYFTRVGFETRSYSQLYDVAFSYNPNGAKLEQIGSGLSRFSYENKPDIIFADDSAPNINLIIDPVEVYSATGGKGNDILIVKPGSTQGAVISGGDGNDQLIGADGNDIFTGGAGIDSIDGGAGDDLITIDKNDNLNNIKGGTGFDVLVIEGDGDVSFTLDNLGVEVVNGNQGNNVFTANGTQDVVISGGAGNDTITGGQGNDRLEGNEGNDSLNGRIGDDNLIGGSGDDYINGGAGNDTMNGGSGNDIYVVDSTGDVVTETSTLATEIDTVQSSISYTLGANVENLTLTSTGNINGTGNSLNNTITGNAANNILNAGVGNDSVFGMEGTDTIFGGIGADTLTGGLGADRFVYFNFNDSLLPAPDRIIDFNPGQGDRIVLNSQPTALFNAGIFSTATYSTLNAAAIAAYQDANPNLAGTQPLAVNQAVFFGWNGGTYLSVNDSLAAFNSSSDLLINVTGITGTLATGLLTINNYFSV
ncbi:MAG: LamG-like jellyroll fold domain-containing protein [Dolichospermum lemmermannii FEM_B0920]